MVLIPLLLDDPLWDTQQLMAKLQAEVLIPLLLDDPLWDKKYIVSREWEKQVLIPLLLDDPLWVVQNPLGACP